ncbi:MAG: lysoplasmalogenase [Bacteroidota bacterium]
MKSLPVFFHLAFFLLCLTNLYAEWADSILLIYGSKPLLITSLAAYFYWSTVQYSIPFRHLIFLGLLFSVGGDTILMFVENDAQYAHCFVYGLGSFLITHLFYGYAFVKWPKQDKGLLSKFPWLMALLLLFFLGNSVFLWPDLPEHLQIPVVVYSAIILSMTTACIHLYGCIPNISFQLLLAGVLLFVLSDSIIALNKFKGDQFLIPYVRLIIMLTYLAGQYLIVRGAVSLLKSQGQAIEYNDVF